ncbi:polymer-forming cytoskeletal protein [uncultured Limnohabitans sp.]|uniref:bactofilin family protein n=1 Tax=uncultured Limnohabitans sp. TaxID=768543 RepID=UPI00262F8DD2|nr:polymer-forming cytoskeletal protein [uncultured Limnohabitans sp.]MDP4622332.1 polymer-forming cytoskeletal protein [Hydrogenophaga sp.]
MFGKKKTTYTPLVMSQEKFDTLIGRHAEIHGCLRLQESVRIDGKVVGNIEAPKDAAISVVIGPNGEVQGDVLANRIIVAGKVAGNIHAFERVEIMASALVQGDIKYASMAVEHGARLLGLLLQVDASDVPSRSGQDAHEAIKKAQTSVSNG